MRRRRVTGGIKYGRLRCEKVENIIKANRKQFYLRIDMIDVVPEQHYNDMRERHHASNLKRTCLGHDIGSLCGWAPLQILIAWQIRGICLKIAYIKDIEWGSMSLM